MMRGGYWISVGQYTKFFLLRRLIIGLAYTWLLRRAVELVHPKRRAARLGDIKEVIQVMQNSPTAAYLRECSLHERMMLASLIKCIKREGVEEIQWGEVISFHFSVWLLPNWYSF